MTDNPSDWRALAASHDSSAYGPQRIVCLTEEPTEWLYLLGEERRIVGISGYTVRPPRARAEKPKVSAYLSAKIDKIVDLKPDCVIGFSDLQADIAAQLIRHGIQVTIFNQRSVAEIFSMLYQLAAMVGQVERGLALIRSMQQRLLEIEQAASGLRRRPRVYFEEWDEPNISAIAWVSELVGIAGGDDCFPELAGQALGKNRIIADAGEIVRRNPDIIFGSWCGKKFRPEKVLARPGWEGVPAVQNRQLFEIKSPDILQPGPAALTDGVEQLHRIIMAWSQSAGASAPAPAPALALALALAPASASASAPASAVACAAPSFEEAMPASERPGGPENQA